MILPRTDHIDENKDGKCDYCKCELSTTATKATQPTTQPTTQPEADAKKPGKDKKTEEKQEAPEETLDLGFLGEISWQLVALSALGFVGAGVAVGVVIFLITKKKRG